MLSLTPLQDKINCYFLNKENIPFIKNGGLKRLLDDLFEIIIDMLPHGSGIDNNWKLDQFGTIISCYNSYHAIDRNKSYCGWVDFAVKINLESLDFDVDINKEDIQTIYDEYAQDVTKNNNKPYLDNLDDNIYQRVNCSLESYLIRESIRYAKQFYPEILRQELNYSQ